MILTDNEVTERMESPINLMNRLAELSKREHKNSHRNFIPSLPPAADDLIDNLDEKLNIGSIKSKAARILTAAMSELEVRIPEVNSVDKLSVIAERMNKIVHAQSDIDRKEDKEQAQIIIYAPQHKEESHYQVINVNEVI